MLAIFDSIFKNMIYPQLILDHPQLTFREVLTMLAIFDSIFITTASVTFSLPLLSSYWQVQIHVKIQLLMKIQAKIQIQIQNNGHPGLGAPPSVPVAVAAYTNLSQWLDMVQFIFVVEFLQQFLYFRCVP